MFICAAAGPTLPLARASAIRSVTPTDTIAYSEVARDYTVAVVGHGSNDSRRLAKLPHRPPLPNEFRRYAHYLYVVAGAQIIHNTIWHGEKSK